VTAAERSPLVAHPGRFGAALVASGLVHAVGLALALAFRPPPLIDLEQKPIVARLVRLGEKRQEQLLPRKEEPPPPAAAEPEPVPAPPGPRAESTPAPSPKPPSPPRAPAAGPRSDALAAAVSRMRRQQALSGSAGGDPSGDPFGDASEGEAGDRYLALCTRALQEVYRLPATISERDRLHLRANLRLFLEADGRLVRWTFESRSGNGAFDDALGRAVQQARFPPPPPELLREIRTNGLLVRFSV
jgi:colicin import membrane protein/protein TonB